MLGGGAPVYDREYKEPAYFAENKKFNIDSVEEPEDLKAVARQLVQQLNIASKKWVYQQYDSMGGYCQYLNQPPDRCGHCQNSRQHQVISCNR